MFKMPGFPPRKSVLKGKLSYPDAMFRDVLFVFFASFNLSEEMDFGNDFK